MREPFPVSLHTLVLINIWRAMTMPGFFYALARFAKVILLGCIFLTMLQMLFYPSIITLLLLAGLITVMIIFFLEVK